jgi:peptidoglycan/LPS O-acetylase OafA/YrhL
MSSSPAFFSRIEGMRGLAALSVAIFHSVPLVIGDRVVALLDLRVWAVSDVEGGVVTALTILFNGSAAVSVFFVVSGFVLGLSLDRDRRPACVTAAAFGLHRLARIMPALGVNLTLTLLAWMALAALAPPPLIEPVPDLAAYLRNLLLLDFTLNYASWTLQIELQAVAIIVAAHFARARWGEWVLPAVTALAIVVIFLPSSVRGLRVADYAFMFLLGMMIARRVPLAACGKGRAAALVCVGLVMLLATRSVLGFSSRWTLLAEGCGAAMLCTVAAMRPPVRLLAALDRGVVRHLGRISYSFYLYHPSMLLLMGAPMKLARLAGLPAVVELAIGLAAAAATVAGAFAAGWLSYLVVERPCIAGGRWLSARLLGARLPASPLAPDTPPPRIGEAGVQA